MLAITTAHTTSQHFISYSTLIGGVEVTFSVIKEHKLPKKRRKVGSRKAYIEFSIGGVYERTSSNRLAIARWVKEQWERVKPQLLADGFIIVTSPYSEDGEGSYRYKMYLKLGFIPVYGEDMVYGGVLPPSKRKDIPPKPPGVEGYIEWTTYTQQTHEGYNGFSWLVQGVWITETKQVDIKYEYCAWKQSFFYAIWEPDEGAWMSLD